MNKVSLGIIGAGWRSEFFLRIARDLPDQFPLAGIVVRDAAKRERVAAEWRVPVFETVDELLSQSNPGFVVTSVPWAVNLPMLELLAARNVPALSETPVATDLEGMHRVCELVRGGARIQVAEQYLFQPMHAALQRVVESGRLGPVSQATVSVAHGYHGISLLRRYLGVGLALPTITARKFMSQIVGGPGRGGPPKQETLLSSERVIAQLDYGDRLGIYDFVGDQYFSWIRSQHLLVRGERGEINQQTVRLLQDYRTPIQFDLVRRDTGQGGNLEGYAHQTIVGGGEILYQNPFSTARWSDDEIAVATSLVKMQQYVATGEEFYSVAEACQDRYLDVLIAEAAASGERVEAKAQPWCTR